MREDEKSPTHIDVIQERINLKITAQTGMRWLMGRLLAQLLNEQLPKGFTCKYVKDGEVAWNKGEATSDELVISDSNGSVWARIHVGYLAGTQMTNLRVNMNDGFGNTINAPANRRLLKVLQQWVKEFELTSNLEKILGEIARVTEFNQAEKKNRRRRLASRRKARRSKTRQ